MTKKRRFPLTSEEIAEEIKQAQLLVDAAETVKDVDPKFRDLAIASPGHAELIRTDPAVWDFSKVVSSEDLGPLFTRLSQEIRFAAGSPPMLQTCELRRKLLSDVRQWLKDLEDSRLSSQYKKKLHDLMSTIKTMVDKAHQSGDWEKFRVNFTAMWELYESFEKTPD